MIIVVRLSLIVVVDGLMDLDLWMVVESGMTVDIRMVDGARMEVDGLTSVDGRRIFYSIYMYKGGVGTKEKGADQIQIFAADAI
jgi:hypothetical protein